MLIQLHASQPNHVFAGPIAPISGVSVVDAYKCTITNGTCDAVFSDKKRFNEHCWTSHGGIPAQHRAFSVVKAQPLHSEHNHTYLVEVIYAPSPSSAALVEEIEVVLSSSEFYSVLDVFQPSSNQRTKGTVFAQLGWDQLLVGVSILQSTVVSPKEFEPAYLKLTQAIGLYYASTSLLIPSLPILTA
jgi:hypothetical protein